MRESTRRSNEPNCIFVHFHVFTQVLSEFFIYIFHTSFIGNGFFSDFFLELHQKIKYDVTYIRKKTLDENSKNLLK
jgi:hypothetical protein